MTRPVLGVTETMPYWSGPTVQSSSTPVIFPPVLSARRAGVFIHSWKLSLSAADLRYVAIGPFRSPPENMYVVGLYVWFFDAGASLGASTFVQPPFANALPSMVAPSFMYNTLSTEGELVPGILSKTF